MTSGDDDELNALNAEYSGRWHITRREDILDAAREPGRTYHVLALSPGELEVSIGRVERDGSLVR